MKCWTKNRNRLFALRTTALGYTREWLRSRQLLGSEICLAYAIIDDLLRGSASATTRADLTMVLDSGVWRRLTADEACDCVRVVSGRVGNILSVHFTTRQKTAVLRYL